MKFWSGSGRLDPACLETKSLFVITTFKAQNRGWLPLCVLALFLYDRAQWTTRYLDGRTRRDMMGRSEVRTEQDQRDEVEGPVRSGSALMMWPLFLALPAVGLSRPSIRPIFASSLCLSYSAILPFHLDRFVASPGHLAVAQLQWICPSRTE